MNNQDTTIAIVIPCFNEAGAIGQTIDAFQMALPNAAIYVYDNNSTDETVSEAKRHGALVYHEPRQGKGEVVRRMLADVEADVYIMTDGDNTYDASLAAVLVETLNNENLDMIVGTRSYVETSFPQGHILGNKVFSKLINIFFNAELTDVFSGYRVMSRRFVKSLPLVSLGFEIETEITVHALQTRVALKEVPIRYSARPAGTVSKLRTFSDGFRILGFIFFLLRDVKPLLFFCVLSLLSGTTSLSLGIPIIIEFFETGLVPRFPTAILASAFALITVICLFVGVILDNVSRGRLEAKQLRYLNISGTKNG